MPGEKRLLVHGPAGDLECRLLLPEATDPPRVAAIVAHPHPLYGGSMDNAVVDLATQVLAHSGAAALRFNFRGVGGSDGEHDGGTGEVLDLIAVESEVAERYPDSELWLVGYSFGAMVVLNRMHRTDAASEVGLVVVLAPPLTHYEFSFLRQNTTPLAIICGEIDTLTPVDRVEALEHDWGAVARTETLPGAGHDLGCSSDPKALHEALERAIGAAEG